MRWKASGNIPQMGVKKGFVYDLDRKMLQEINAYEGRLRAVKDERESYMRVQACASLLLNNVETLKRLGQHKLTNGKGCRGYAKLKQAIGLIDSALEEMSDRMNIDQVISHSNETRNYGINISQNPSPGFINIDRFDLKVIAQCAQEQSCKSCNDYDKPKCFKDCQLRQAFEHAPTGAVERNDDASGLHVCPYWYFAKTWEDDSDMELD